MDSTSLSDNSPDSQNSPASTRTNTNPTVASQFAGQGAGNSTSIKVVGGEGNIHITTTQAPRNVVCDIPTCGALQEEAQCFVCPRCQRRVCKRHKDVELLVCEECAAIKRRESQPASGRPCQFQGCGKPVPTSQEFSCQRCNRIMCPSHRDASLVVFCASCAETERRQQFEKFALNHPLTGAAADAARELASISQPQPPFQARIWTQSSQEVITRDITVVPRHSKGGYRIGDLFKLNCQTQRDCYLTLIDLGTSGNIYLLLQNHFLRAGAPVTLTGPDAQHEWRIAPPPGVERLKALFTLRPLALFPGRSDFSALTQTGATRDVLTELRHAGQLLRDMPADAWVDDSCEFSVEP